MRAIQMNRYGPPGVLELREVELPELGPHEVRIKTLAAPVNRADLEIRSGNWPIQREQPFPYTPGLEVTGRVVAIGAAVKAVSEGQIVTTMMQRLGGIHGVRPGGYQEFVTVEDQSLAVLPPGLDPHVFAALGLAGVTALEGLSRLGSLEGRTVVIHGASGGVGSVALRLAKLFGAHVIATTGRAEKRDALRAQGADRVVALDDGLLGTLGARTVDAVFDTIGGVTFRESVAVLRRGGHLCLVGAASGEHLDLSAWDLLQDLHLTGFSSENLTGDGLRTQAKRLSAWLATGELSPPPFETFALSQASQVHHMMERRDLQGRALLVP